MEISKGKFREIDSFHFTSFFACKSRMCGQKNMKFLNFDLVSKLTWRSCWIWIGLDQTCGHWWRFPALDGSVSHILGMITIICWGMTLLEFRNKIQNVLKLNGSTKNMTFARRAESMKIKTNYARPAAKELRRSVTENQSFIEKSLALIENKSWDFLRFSQLLHRRHQSIVSWWRSQSQSDKSKFFYDSIHWQSD